MERVSERRHQVRVGGVVKDKVATKAMRERGYVW